MLRFVVVGFALLASISAASAFEGKYASDKGGYRQSAEIARSGAGYSVKLDVATPGCTGDFEGAGTAAGGKLTARTDDKTDECRIEITRTPKGIKVSEDRCMMWHGARCEFGGELTKR